MRGSYPNTTNPLVAGGGDVTGYQAGSTFKVFTIVAALEQGIPLAYTIDSPYRVTTDYPVERGGPASCGNRWCPSNYAESVGGVHNMWSGLGRSVNTFFAQLIERAGAQNVVDMAARLGVKFRDEQDAQYAANADAWGAFTLGVSATTPLDLANSYATISAEGMHCEPIPVEEIRTMDGEKLDIANPICKRVVDKDVARATIDAGRCVVGDQSHFGRCQGGTASETRGIVGKPIWGKTGTSDGSKTYSFVVSTRTLTVAAQLADPDWAQTNQRMQSHPVRAAVARTLADAMKGTDPGNWPAAGEQQTRPRRPGQHPLGGVPIGRGGPLHPEQRRLPGEGPGHPGRLRLRRRSGGGHQPQRSHHPRRPRDDPGLQRLRLRAGARGEPVAAATGSRRGAEPPPGRGPRTWRSHQTAATTARNRRAVVAGRPQGSVGT